LAIQSCIKYFYAEGFSLLLQLRCVRRTKNKIIVSIPGDYLTPREDIGLPLTKITEFEILV
jgi:hypothetical protein